jgi:arsenical pump membrane protein
MTAAQATWGIAALATAGVIVRPGRLPEATWAVLGAAALVAFGLLSWSDTLAGVLKGTDVYLFLAGMMLLAELARQACSTGWRPLRSSTRAARRSGCSRWSMRSARW